MRTPGPCSGIPAPTPASARRGATVVAGQPGLRAGECGRRGGPTRIDPEPVPPTAAGAPRAPVAAHTGSAGTAGCACRPDHRQVPAQRRILCWRTSANNRLWFVTPGGHGGDRTGWRSGRGGPHCSRTVAVVTADRCPGIALRTQSRAGVSTSDIGEQSDGGTTLPDLHNAPGFADGQAQRTDPTWSETRGPAQHPRRPLRRPRVLRNNLPMHIGSLLIFDGPAPPAYEDLLAHVSGQRLDRLPRYRQVIREVPFNLGIPTWQGRRALQPRVPRTPHRAPRAG